MKRFQSRFLLGVLLSLVLQSACLAQIVVNGDFETQYPNTPPTGYDPTPAYPLGAYNIRWTNPGGNNRPRKDELPGWYSVERTSDVSNQNSVGNYENVALFVATNSLSNSNPQSPTDPIYAYSPHSGLGCALFGREPGTFTIDGMITQSVNLIAGHLYKVQFYALRQPNIGPRAAKLSLSMVNNSSAPLFKGGPDSPNITNISTLVPTPYAVIASNYLTMNDGIWAQVNGSFVAQSSTNNWVVVGYDRANYIDASLPRANFSDFVSNMIDDVSIVDMGCAPVNQSRITVTNHDPCNRQTSYAITNFNPALTYQINTLSGPIAAVPPNPTTSAFRIKGGAGSKGGTFNITATSVCGNTATTGIISTSFTCLLQSAISTAYPNPTSELLQASGESKDAMLLDYQGNLVLKANELGEFDTRKLPSGLYNLRTIQRGEVVNQRIQIVH